ncbi:MULTISPECIES: hypothetical protein [Bacteroides]|uniref:hypothetical protein n=1 Tax=Bacteroides TaxID=816 RepID=UPI00189B8989|nr:MULTISPECIES: hypothetical protein [Bacteroides]
MRLRHWSRLPEVVPGCILSLQRKNDDDFAGKPFRKRAEDSSFGFSYMKEHIRPLTSCSLFRR